MRLRRHKREKGGGKDLERTREGRERWGEREKEGSEKERGRGREREREREIEAGFYFHGLTENRNRFYFHGLTLKPVLTVVLPWVCFIGDMGRGSHGSMVLGGQNGKEPNGDGRQELRRPE